MKKQNLLGERLQVDMVSGKATLVETKEIWSGNMTDVISTFSSQSDQELGPFPRGTIRVSKSGELTVYILFQPASVQQVGVNIVHDGQSYDYVDLDIVVPQRFLLVPEKNGKVLTSSARIVGANARDHQEALTNHKVDHLWLPNQHFSTMGSFCGGPGIRLNVNQAHDSVGKIERLVDYVNRSVYNDHLPQFWNFVPIPVFNWEGSVDNKAAAETKPWRDILDKYVDSKKSRPNKESRPKSIGNNNHLSLIQILNGRLMWHRKKTGSDREAILETTMVQKNHSESSVETYDDVLALLKRSLNDY